MTSYLSLPVPILLICYVYADDIFLFWCLRWFLNPRVQLDCHCIFGSLSGAAGWSFWRGCDQLFTPVAHHTSCSGSQHLQHLRTASALTRRQTVLCRNSQPSSPAQVLILFVLESLAIFSSRGQCSVNPLTQRLQTLLLSRTWFLTWSPA